MASVRCWSPRCASPRGFTLIEMLIAVAVAGVLAGIAYPSIESQFLRARRSDALLALWQAQLAEERHRADHRSFGALADIGVRATSSAGHYNLQVANVSADGYELVATATGRQARDAACRTLRLASAGSNLGYASGPDLASSNPADVNRRCWNQ